MAGPGPAAAEWAEVVSKAVAREAEGLLDGSSMAWEEAELDCRLSVLVGRPE